MRQSRQWLKFSLCTAASLLSAGVWLAGCHSLPAGSGLNPELTGSAPPAKSADFALKAQTGVAFQLETGGLSHLYWPFTEARSEWNSTSGNGAGQGDHIGDDYYADDWNLNLGGNKDAGRSLLAAMPGEVIYVRGNGSNGDGGCGGSADYGNQVIIASGDFALRYTHLQSVAVSRGQRVQIGDNIGTVGFSGLSGKDACTAHLHLALYQHINDLSKQNRTARSWLEQGSVPTSISGGASNFAAKFQLDATTGGAGTANQGIFDGAGSVISPSEECFGCNHDIAMMHPHAGTGSTVVFQVNKVAPYTDHVDLKASQDLEVIVKLKKWNDHLTAQTLKIKLKALVPVSLPLADDPWTTFAVTSTGSLSSDALIYVDARRASDPWKDSGAQILPNELVDVTYGSFWTGTGSLISSAKSSQDFGIRQDEAVTFSQHDSLTSFQWLTNRNCSQIELKTINNQPAQAEVSLKIWNERNESYGVKCNSLPCRVSATVDNYYILKIKSGKDAIAGGAIYAQCK